MTLIGCGSGPRRLPGQVPAATAAARTARTCRRISARQIRSADVVRCGLSPAGAVAAVLQIICLVDLWGVVGDPASLRSAKSLFRAEVPAGPTPQEKYTEWTKR